MSWIFKATASTSPVCRPRGCAVQGLPYRGVTPPLYPQAITARDSMAKSLYSALFDWIVLRINHALLNKKDMEESVSVSVLPPPHLSAQLGQGRPCPWCHTGGWSVTLGAKAAVASVRRESSSS